MKYVIPKVRIVPEADSQVSFQVEGRERLRYHFGAQSPRPFFYPVIGPSGRSLTRMGHPAAPDHDHHRSLWFAHNNVAGNNFWAEGQAPRIRQLRWIHYQDGASEAVMAVELGWFDAHNALLMTQELIAGLRPIERGQTLIELQATFSTRIDPLVLNKSNFGLLAVRMAKEISRHYGGGQLRNSEGAVGEPALFGKPARWVDYSGPVTDGNVEGIAYLPHPGNPDHPSQWHVRDDGWMCASFNLQREYRLVPKAPLELRYLLFVHAGPASPVDIEAQYAAFAALPAYAIVAAKSPWRVAVQRRAT